MHLGPPCRLGCCPIEAGGPVDSLFIIALILGFCVCSIFCCALLCVLSSFANNLVVSWCLVTVVVLWLVLAVPCVGMQ